MITDILFDLGNVLVPLRRERAYERLLPHLSPELARLAREDRRSFEALFREPAERLETGRIEFAEFQRVMSAVLGIRVDDADFHEIWCDIFDMDESMVKLGEDLSTEYGTWLVSNTSDAHYRWILDKFPRVAFYRGAALSYHLGVMKPSPRYYQQALSMFGIDPAGAVFIDDLEANVAGAERASLRGILFQGRTHLIGELGALGVRLPEHME